MLQIVKFVGEEKHKAFPQVGLNNVSCLTKLCYNVYSVGLLLLGELFE